MYAISENFEIGRHVMQRSTIMEVVFNFVKNFDQVMDHQSHINNVSVEILRYPIREIPLLRFGNLDKCVWCF